MQVFIDRIKDKVFVKSNGKVVTAKVVKRKPKNDIVTTNDDESAYNESVIELKEAIKEAKEKAELYKLGIESEESFMVKVDQYRDAKKRYNLLKEKV